MYQFLGAREIALLAAPEALDHPRQRGSSRVGLQPQAQHEVPELGHVASVKVPVNSRRILTLRLQAEFRVIWA
jgi:hypothetical protein